MRNVVHRSPLLVGFGMVAIVIVIVIGIGIVIVGFTIALGGGARYDEGRIGARSNT